ncbi:4-hydroxy-3-methylbut-2-enyl diphosphate reductase [Parasporobacterium paucivorans]|uniref:4-hydroxy-3-methylbut-2-enyl diphosphate reductase n=1 Tax=Parasporobacterium paucivorans DSM 15970 TaxID=1122934 RepID=A0A1M6F6Q1_9FIRM|nr:4-hydroxy-3-methylbut-2-enyl diphosphate reductase [Parasporobacterium paucivorans]SHI93387.1 4-hydroxy-3-methylbut-2-enyl diphosphate reductase [Parasporobacterium paucivorans DSM 15970]
MKVKLAKTAGFCFGVKRAVDCVWEQIKNNPDGKQVYTYGPIIHNEQVVDEFSKLGVKVINDEEELKSIKGGIIIIRSHGAPKSAYDIIESSGATMVDATCPYVRRIQKEVDKESQEKEIIIIGDRNHPEIVGIAGWSKTPPVIIETKDEALKYVNNSGKPLFIVAQTTFNQAKFKDLVEIISKKGYDITVLNTICNATHDRQTEAEQIASEVDAMIVIGGKESSNTRKLYEICKERCKDTYHIQTLEDLDLSSLQSTSCVGITAGASTPNNIIEEVHTNVRIKF